MLGARAGLRLVAASLLLGLATVSVATLPASVAGASPTSSPCPAPVITGSTAVVTCSYDGTTGADGTTQAWTVPVGVTQATFDVFGAQGGDGNGPIDGGGDGGETKALLSVTSGTSFDIVVAGAGEPGNSNPGLGGFGGGGAGGATNGSGDTGAGGGGGSSVSAASSDTLLLVAGGGGGNQFATSGGAGGGLSGTSAPSTGDPDAGPVGLPGTQLGGGNGTGGAGSGVSGQGGSGAEGSLTRCSFAGSGGGGGYFGGSGGGDCSGGGGGSGFAGAGLSPTFKTGVRSGNGVVTITYDVPSPCPAPVITGTTAVVTCSYNGTTGADGSGQTWTVPAGVTQATFDVFGAQGGTNDGGLTKGGYGGETTSSVSVTPSTIFTVGVGGRGGYVATCGLSASPGGFGGGGAGGAEECAGSGGGGASSVSDGDTLLLVAGGGGGATNICRSTCSDGGTGGGLSGTAGGSPPGIGTGGAPGTQAGGGIGTDGAGTGVAGQGGAGSSTEEPCSELSIGGGGGGGGYFGGAGGAPCSGGGGGSGYAAPGLPATLNTGVQFGNGVVTITYTLPATTSTTKVSVSPTGATAVVGNGATLSDDLTVTGTGGGPAPTNTAGGVDFYVCQVSTSTTFAPGVCPATGPPYDATEILAGTGDQGFAGSTFSPTGAGTWCFSTTYAGDSNYAGSADNTTVTDANECALISPASPSITTTPSATSITLGPTPPTLKDSAILAGGYNPTGTITFTLYNPGGTLIDTETATVKGNGTYTTPKGYTLPGTGTVTGTYQWDASYKGDGNNTGISENNATAEQVKVVSPCGSLTAYLLSATSSAGSFTGLFCVNSAGTGTYSQNGGPTVTGTVKISGTTTAIAASGPNLVLLGQRTSTYSTFTETAPTPMKTGTFTLATLP